MRIRATCEIISEIWPKMKKEFWVKGQNSEIFIKKYYIKININYIYDFFSIYIALILFRSPLYIKP